MNNKFLISIVGATALGKTALSIHLAKHFHSDIISCDSRQFYKEMSIGTAVPSSEELAAVPHHFIQQRSIQEPYSVGAFKREALYYLESLFKTKDTVILVGGSGLYADALIDGLDHFPEVNPTFRKELNKQLDQEGIEGLAKRLKNIDPAYHQKVDLGNPHRLIRALEICLSSGLPYSSFLGNKKAPTFFKTQKIVLQWDRPILYERINQRVDQMVAAGLETEAQSLYPNKGVNALQTVGYREWFSHFDGTLDRTTTLEEIKKNTRHYAKRQITWFKRYQDVLLVPGGSSVEDVLRKLN